MHHRSRSRRRPRGDGTRGPRTSSCTPQPSPSPAVAPLVVSSEGGWSAGRERLANAAIMILLLCIAVGGGFVVASCCWMALTGSAHGAPHAAKTPAIVFCHQVFEPTKGYPGEGPPSMFRAFHSCEDQQQPGTAAHTQTPPPPLSSSATPPVAPKARATSSRPGFTAFDSPIPPSRAKSIPSSGLYGAARGKSKLGEAASSSHQPPPPPPPPRDEPECPACDDDDTEPDAKRVQYHPSYLEWRGSYLTTASLQNAFFGCNHKCKHNPPCHQGLWGPPETALLALKAQRTACPLCAPSALPTPPPRSAPHGSHTMATARGRRSTIADRLLCASTGEYALPILHDRDDKPRNWCAERRRRVYTHLALTNATATNLQVAGRSVCRAIFLAHWCISSAQLDRFLGMLREGVRDFAAMKELAEAARARNKSAFVISWFVQYAAEITEKLPDSTTLLLPRASWGDMHSEFKQDMSACECSQEDICGETWFRKVFKTADELKDMQITRFKGNFGKCCACIRLTANVVKALKGHDAAALETAKAERLAHYMLAGI